MDQPIRTHSTTLYQIWSVILVLIATWLVELMKTVIWLVQQTILLKVFKNLYKMEDKVNFNLSYYVQFCFIWSILELNNMLIYCVKSICYIFCIFIIFKLLLQLKIYLYNVQCEKCTVPTVQI